MNWLMEKSVLAEYQAKLKTCVVSAEQLQAASKIHNSKLITASGGNATLHIKGILTPSRDIFAEWFGGGNTTYPGIIAALAELEADRSIRKVELVVDSPGGAVDGLFPAIDAIRGFTKPTTTRFVNIGASAAFALGVQADKVFAEHRATRVGSIGVVVTMFTDENQVDITSSNAPKKRPDVKTAEGREDVRAELDELETLFIDSIAEGRRVTSTNVINNFGQGAVVTAGPAKKKGMIDGIVQKKAAVKKSGVKVEKKMNLDQLKADHPEVYAAAIKIGVNNERDRAGAHLTYGKAGNCLDRAAKAILDGEPLTETLKAEYTVAGVKQGQMAARDQDTNNVDSALGNAATPTEETNKYGTLEAMQSRFPGIGDKA